MEPAEVAKRRNRLVAAFSALTHWLASNRRLALFVEFVFLFLLFGELDRVIQVGLNGKWGRPSPQEASFRSWALASVTLLLLVTLAIIGFTIRVLDQFSANQDGVSMRGNARRKRASIAKLVALDESDAQQRDDYILTEELPDEFLVH